MGFESTELHKNYYKRWSNQNIIKLTVGKVRLFFGFRIMQIHVKRKGWKVT